jgi:hypothetical protein
MIMLICVSVMLLMIMLIYVGVMLLMIMVMSVIMVIRVIVMICLINKNVIHTNTPLRYAQRLYAKTQRHKQGRLIGMYSVHLLLQMNMPISQEQRTIPLH